MVETAQHHRSLRNNHQQHAKPLQNRRCRPCLVVAISMVSLIAFQPNPASNTNEKHENDPLPDLVLNSSANSSLPSSYLSGLRVAWLLSFPNSGTSYTIGNIQQLTNQSIASNYATDEAGSLSVGPDENGPFIDEMHALPQNYILTKTHCGAYCSMCPPHDSILNTAGQFEKQCRLSTVPKKTDQFYPMGTAARAIHLIRHPLDNLVARLHLFLKRYPNFPERYHGFDTQVAQQKTENERVLAWCRYTDTIEGEHFATTPLLTTSTKRIIQSQQPLCALELFRYIQWHQRALEMTTQLGLPVLYIYYEDYNTEQTYNSTVSRILDFLKAAPASGATPLPFTVHAPYNVFTQEQQDAMGKYIRRLASNEAWKLVERYFQ